MDVKEMIKGASGMAATEVKKTYNEFSLVKTLIYSVIALCILFVGIVVSAQLDLLLMLIGIISTFLLSVAVLWKGLQWMFPRYMIVDHLLNSKKRRKVLGNSRLPKFKGF